MSLRLTRPGETDVSVLLCVAGTYTSPAGDIEGFVMVDGKVERAMRKPWEGRVVIIDGRVTIERGRHLTPLPLSVWHQARATVFQAHLLVFDKQVRPLKKSPARQRRALVDVGKYLAVMESEGLVPLATFAEDLVSLGAQSAVNLDMGGWSEGWVRLPTGTASLGHNHSQTGRQSNWLVIGR